MCLTSLYEDILRKTGMLIHVGKFLMRAWMRAYFCLCKLSPIQWQLGDLNFSNCLDTIITCVICTEPHLEYIPFKDIFSPMENCLGESVLYVTWVKRKKKIKLLYWLSNTENSQVCIKPQKLVDRKCLYTVKLAINQHLCLCWPHTSTKIEFLYRPLKKGYIQER